MTINEIFRNRNQNYLGVRQKYSELGKNTLVLHEISGRKSDGKLQNSVQIICAHMQTRSKMFPNSFDDCEIMWEMLWFLFR